ncbi:MAG: DUF4870 domain-containing protein [Crocinitomix sp.]|nr:DUF4870 domain-containing protein [Crocinitomix sp.]
MTESDSGQEEFKPWGMKMNSFLLLMHLSQLSSVIIPLAGLVMPIIMWATNKDQSSVVDEHGKNILNWIISAVVYGLFMLPLIYINLGIIALAALGICTLVFAILGGVKANEGEVYVYPLAIRFIK